MFLFLLFDTYIIFFLTVSPCWLSILNTVVGTCQSQTSNLDVNYIDLLIVLLMQKYAFLFHTNSNIIVIITKYVACRFLYFVFIYIFIFYDTCPGSCCVNRVVKSNLNLNDLK